MEELLRPFIRNWIPMVYMEEVRHSELEIRFGIFTDEDWNPKFLPDLEPSRVQPLLAYLEGLNLQKEVHTIETQSYKSNFNEQTRKRTIDSGQPIYDAKTKEPPTDIPELGVRISFAEETIVEEREYNPRNSQVYSKKVERTSYTLSPIAVLDVSRDLSTGKYQVELEYTGATVEGEEVASTVEELVRYSVDVIGRLRTSTLEGLSLASEPEVPITSGVEGLSVSSESLQPSRPLMLDTSNLQYSQPQMAQFLSHVNTKLGAKTDPSNFTKFIDRAIFTEARNLHRQDLCIGGVVGGRVSYNMAHKSDGQRRILIFYDNRCWLIWPPRINQLIGAFRSNGLTVFDGELIPPEARSNNQDPDIEWFVLIDGLMIEDVNIQNLNFTERQMRSRVWLDSKKLPTNMEPGAGASDVGNRAEDVSDFLPSKLRVIYKEFRHISSPDTFFQIFNQLIEEQNSGKLLYKTDGLILTPATEVGYDTGSYKHSLSSRVLTSVPDVCKWKPPHLLTNDFQLVMRDGFLVPHVMDETHYGTKHPFEGTQEYPFDFKTMMSHKLPPEIKQEDLQYPIECVWTKNFSGKFVYTPYRVRREKSGPNRRDVALDNWVMVRQQLTTERMRGLNFEWMREYHNDIKESLLQRSLKASVPPSSAPKAQQGSQQQSAPTLLLDIGSGAGGDLSKWYSFDVIIAVEPNPNNAQQFRTRLQSHPRLTSKVTLLETGGEDTESIVRTVMAKSGDKGADVISLMNSMTFFWQSETKLGQLASTIRSCSRPGTQIVWIVMDGEAVAQSLSPFFGGPEVQDLQYGNFRLVPTENWKNDGLVRVTFKGGIVGEDQREWLVSTSQLLRLLPASQVLKKRATDENFMPENDRKVSAFYSYGIWQVNSNSERNQAMQNPRSTSSILPSFFPPSVPSQPVPPFPGTQYSQAPVVPRTSSQGYAFGAFKYHNGIGYEILPTPQQISSMGYSLVRLDTIPDGNCFIHSILQAIDPQYLNLNRQQKTETASIIRSELANWLLCDDERFQNSKGVNRCNWETTSNCGILTLYLNQLAELCDVITNARDIPGLGDGRSIGHRDGQIDLSLAGLYSLFNSNAYLGNEIFQTIADVLGITIYTVRLTSDGSYQAAGGDTNGIGRPTIFVLHLGGHYETLALKHSSGQLITVFPPSRVAGAESQHPTAELMIKIVPRDHTYRQEEIEVTDPTLVYNEFLRLMTRYDAEILFSLLSKSHESARDLRFCDPVFEELWVRGEELQRSGVITISPYQHYMDLVQQQYRTYKATQWRDQASKSQYHKTISSNLMWISMMQNKREVRHGARVHMSWKRGEKIVEEFDNSGNDISQLIARAPQQMESANSRADYEEYQYLADLLVSNISFESGVQPGFNEFNTVLADYNNNRNIILDAE